jgi:hypothetical protein
VDSAFITDTTAFKQAMSGVELVYELATPTTEQAQPYTNPQIVDPDGTEEYVTANNVPVGHDSTYALVCPISGYDEVSAVVSPTTTASDGQTYTADLPQTVYGGAVDLVSGEMVVDRAMVELEYLDWSDSTSTRYISKTVPGMVAVPSSTTLPNMMAERYRVVKWSDGLANNHDAIAVSNNDQARLYLYKDADTQSPTGKIVYELATPQTIQLTPQEIRTLLGTNNVWSNGSNTYIKYVADTGLFIIKKIDEALNQ